MTVSCLLKSYRFRVEPLRNLKSTPSPPLWYSVVSSQDIESDNYNLFPNYLLPRFQSAFCKDYVPEDWAPYVQDIYNLILIIFHSSWFVCDHI